jgi:hypothetical protein
MQGDNGLQRVDDIQRLQIDNASEKVQDKLGQLGSRWHAMCGVPLPEFKSFQCLFTLHPMIDPVTASDNHTYSKRSLDEYFANQRVRGIIKSPRHSRDYVGVLHPKQGLETRAGRVRQQSRNSRK